MLVLFVDAGAFFVNLCQAICMHNTASKTRGKEMNRSNDQKGQETNGVEGKTRPMAGRKRDKLDGRGLNKLRKWDKRPDRRPRG